MLQIIQQSQKETKPAIFGNCDWLHVTTGNLILEEKQQQKKRALTVINKYSMLPEGKQMKQIPGCERTDFVQYTELGHKRTN